MKFLPFLKPVLGAVGDYFSRKHELRMKKLDLKFKIEEAKTAAAISREAAIVQGALNWEIMSIQNSGWKDEYITVLFTLPYIAVFLPWTQDYVHAGFEYIDATPFWYQMVLLAIIGSALGVRIWDAFAKPLLGRKALAGKAAEASKLEQLKAT